MERFGNRCPDKLLKFRFMDLPNYHVSYQIRDAWLCIPPCSYSENPYCHVDCPYFYECNSQEDYCEDED